VPDATADKLSGLKGKGVKLTATVEQAYFRGGTFHVLASNFVLDGIKTGLPAALEELKSAPPAARRERVEALGRFAAGVGARDALPALVELLKDQDAGVRQAAARVVAAIDPADKAAVELLPPKASAEGKYTRLLRVLYLPGDKSRYNDYSDSGHYDAYSEYEGYKNIPAGYWVYLHPCWYVWDGEKK
jgi:HEAT repeats